MFNIATTASMRGSQAPEADTAPQPTAVLSGRIIAVVVVFIALQATNSATVSIMSLFVTDRMGLDVAWAGVALGVAAGLEIPALLLIGKLSGRVPVTRLLLSGCLAGVAYYAAMAFAAGPVLLLGLQILNASFFAVVAGVGLTLFQDMIPRPGLAAGLYANTHRLGAVASGPLIGVGSTTALGYGGVYLGCAVITVAAFAVLRMVPAGHSEGVRDRPD
ncbi:MFS transporter [Mangrovihabitans endophyticus]|uniref:Major Facilitator Superfamily protein n=1 Tax=Mangrovihabitans endophyticus TaxID=1751298 RepID=A0A8J3C466_9ACTN|nr:MFS transporter [Mangrovihabitans endophyticus]GGL16159.1 hypothetical protein GCM10012284_58490 [Mangrovihabitans endophyticus]